MKTWKNLDEKETGITKWGWEVKPSMCYLVLTALKLIRCN